jgi:hypothetical protein
LRAHAVIMVLKRENAKSHKIEEWREQQLVKFVVFLIAAAADLERAYSEKRVHTLAWVTRSLLELSVWIDFYNSSEEHAKRFRDDVAKDLYRIAQGTQRFSVAEYDSENKELKDSQARLSEFAEKLEIGNLSDASKHVSDAADELGRNDMFLGLSELLSKFAHTTPYTVNSILSVEADAGFVICS